MIGGNIRIESGSVGYSNLTDKPDLSIYETRSEFKVFADQIRGEVGQINVTAGGTKEQLDAFQKQVQQNVNTLINRANAADGNIYKLQTAGFMTKDGVNAWWSAGLTEKGEQVASYISQSPTAIKMISEHLDINAIATFRSYKSAIGNIVSSNRAGVEQNRTTAQNAQTAAQNALTAAQKTAAAVQSLPSWVNKRTIRAALEGETIISGGFINTSLIDTKNLVVKQAAQIGDFIVRGGSLTVEHYGDWEKAKGIKISPNGGVDIRDGNYGHVRIRGGEIFIERTNANSSISISTDGGITYTKSGVTSSLGIGRIDADWHSYAKLSLDLPHKNHIANMPGSHNFKNVVIDTVTGLMGYE